MTPRQLATRALLGSWLVFSAMPLMLIFLFYLKGLQQRPVEHHLQASLLGLSLLLAPLIVGLVLITRSEKALKQGLVDDRWQPTQIDHLREWLATSTFKFLNYTVVLALLGMLVVAVLYGHSMQFLGPFLYLLPTPVATYGRLKTLVAEPQTIRPWMDWSSVKPLQSDHWGQRT